MSRDELIEFVIGLIREYPKIGRKIEEEEDLKAGHVTEITESIRSEIESVASESAWRNDWSDWEDAPDYSGVLERLRSLLDSGHADAVVDLGRDLWRLGNEQVGSSDDEGEVASRIAECMSVVLQAVMRSSMSNRDKILWTIDTRRSDEYGLLDDMETELAKLTEREAWSEAADTLLGRLDAGKGDRKSEDLLTTHRREGTMNWAIDALERSERREEIIPLLEREAPITSCYGTLVERLLSAERRDEAKAVAMKGFNKIVENAPGLAWALEAKLLKMAEQDKDLPLAASYRSLEFFDRPSMDSYKDLMPAAEAAGCRPAVRDAAIRFLETGIRPDLKQSRVQRDTTAETEDTWPLPFTEITAASTKHTRCAYSEISTLIRIAIFEKDTEDVIRRYDLAKNTKFFDRSIHDEVAAAVKKSHPDLALGI
ncbi:MAG: hypothetical protein V2B18_01000, partial [Pseudomonadota bacterium]